MQKWKKSVTGNKVFEEVVDEGQNNFCKVGHNKDK